MGYGYEQFLENKNDRIDNAAYELLCSIASKKDSTLKEDGHPVDWNMELIGDVVDFAEDLLARKGIPVCRPFYEGDEEVKCYLGTDCKRTDCPFRKGENQ